MRRTIPHYSSSWTGNLSPSTSCFLANPQCFSRHSFETLQGNKIYGPNFPELPLELENNEEVYGVDSILNHGKRGQGYQYYVKWKVYPISEALWEPEQAFSNDENMLSLYKGRHQL